MSQTNGGLGFVDVLRKEGEGEQKEKGWKVSTTRLGKGGRNGHEPDRQLPKIDRTPS